jgi:hypothetical protein
MLKRLRTLLLLLENRNYPEMVLELGAVKGSLEPGLAEKLMALADENNYSELASEIRSLIHRQSAPVPSEPLLSGLKTQVRLLETRISVSHHKKAEMQRLINQFRIRHNSELGILMGKILRLQMDIFYLMRIEDETKQTDYEQAKQDYSAFRGARRKLPKHQAAILHHDDKNRLKKLFREASKWCHPDLAPDEAREQAQQIFMELNTAYYYNDIRKVEEIYQMLSDSKPFAAASVGGNETDRLKARISRLRNELHQAHTEIAEIESSPVFKTIQRIGNWDDYFDELSAKFRLEFLQLQEEHVRLQKRTKNQSGPGDSEGQ